MYRDTKIILEDGIEWIYQAIDFDPSIMSHYYAGEHFLSLNIKEEIENGRLMDRIEDTDDDGFLPKLLEDLKWVIGKGNYKYDGYSLGKNKVSFYFLIKKLAYTKIMNNIKYWAISQDLDGIISYDLKKVQSTMSA